MTEIQTASEAELTALTVNTPEGDSATRNSQPGWAARWWPFVIVLIPGMGISLSYVQRTYVNVIILDGFIHVPFIGAALAPGGSLRDLVQLPFAGEHLLLGYRLYLFANTKLFALDMRLDPVMFVLASAAIAAILYLESRRTFRSLRPELLFLAFVPIGFLSFSFVSPPLYLMTTQFVWGTVVALLIAFLIQRDFDPEQEGRQLLRRPLARALVFIPVYFLLSGAYFPGLVLGLFGMFLFRRVIEHTAWIDRRVVLVAAVLFSCAAAYAYFMTHSPHSISSTSTSSILVFFTDFRGTLLSYVAGIGAALLDSHSLERMSSPAFLAVGLGGLLLMGLSLWIFVKTEMYRKTYLPVYCIFYSLGVITAVRTGRVSGWRWISGEWYSFHLRFFVIGVAWILVNASVEFLRRRKLTGTVSTPEASWPIVVASFAAVFIGWTQIHSNLAQWKRAPYVKEYYEQKRTALLYPQLFDNPAEVLLWPEEPLKQARTVLTTHSLTSFSAQSRREFADRFADQPLRGSDWYGDDWIGRHGEGILAAAEPSPVQFDAEVSPFLSSNRCELRLNGAVIFAGELKRGIKTTVTGQLRVNVNTIGMTCADAVSPSSQGQGGDSRPLAVRLTIVRG